MTFKNFKNTFFPETKTYKCSLLKFKRTSSINLKKKKNHLKMLGEGPTNKIFLPLWVTTNIRPVKFFLSEFVKQ